MARGKASKVGDQRVAKNGYHYTRTVEGWRLTHHIIAEDTLKRPLKPDEMVRFKDGKRWNLNPDNIIIIQKGNGALNRRRAQIEAQIQGLQAELADIEEAVGK